MATHVIEAVDFSIFGARDQQRFSGQFGGEVIAGICNLANVADELPGAREDLLLFDRKYFRIGVERGGQSPGFGDVGIDTKVLCVESSLLIIHRVQYFNRNFSSQSHEDTEWLNVVSEGFAHRFDFEDRMIQGTEVVNSNLFTEGEASPWDHVNRN